MRTTRLLGSLALLTVLLASTVASAGSAAPLQPWNQKITNGKRFSVPRQWDGTAVFDKETGLLWQRNPTVDGILTWEEANYFCGGQPIGDRKGWRLPSRVELLSLVDTPQDGLQQTALFGDVRRTFWSSTPHLSDPDKAFAVDLSEGGTIFELKATKWPALCVRSGLP